MSKKQPELTAAEWSILDAVWHNEPCAAPTVQETLQHRKNWSYSTVKTIMDRMVAKGLLRTKRMRNLVLYRSAITRQQAQRGEIMRTVKRAFNGTLTPMMQFLLETDSLSQGELRELETLIRKRRRKASGRKTKKA